MKTLMIAILALNLCSCTAPQARSGKMASSQGSTARIDDASFPAAEAPEVDADPRSLEERDLELIGRRR